MKVLHVNMSIDSVKGGGTVERVLQIHKALLTLGVDSHILTISNPGNDHDSGLLSSEITKLPCINSRWFIPYPKLTMVKNLVKQADVIHLVNHWTIINVWAYLQARMLGKPYIICPAGALTIFGRSRIEKHLYQLLFGRKIIKNASAAIAISPHEIDVFEKHGLDPQKIHHIPNGVNDADFSYSDSTLFREKIGLGLAPYILFVGRINAIKGPDMLLHAFANLCDKVPHHLVFVGPDGGMVDQLNEQRKELNLTNRVHFSGYMGGDMKSSAYHGAEILVVPSRHEAMSIVALEAAVSSTPVLLTDQCGFSSLADANAALEVSANIKGLTDSLKTMLIDDCELEKMGKYGKEFALKNYTWTIMAKRFLALLNLVK